MLPLRVLLFFVFATCVAAVPISPTTLDVFRRDWHGVKGALRSVFKKPEPEEPYERYISEEDAGERINGLWYKVEDLSRTIRPTIPTHSLEPKMRHMFLSIQGGRLKKVLVEKLEGHNLELAITGLEEKWKRVPATAPYRVSGLSRFENLTSYI